MTNKRHKQKSSFLIFINNVVTYFIIIRLCYIAQAIRL